jgi:hypothetical protein
MAAASETPRTFRVVFPVRAADREQSIGVPKCETRGHTCSVPRRTYQTAESTSGEGKGLVEVLQYISLPPASDLFSLSS